MPTPTSISTAWRTDTDMQQKNEKGGQHGRQGKAFHARELT
jgi:hypothetical protein